MVQADVHTDSSADRPRQDFRQDSRPPSAPERNGTPISAPTGPRGSGPPTGPRGMTSQNGSATPLHNHNSPAVPSPLAGASTPTPSSPKPSTPGDVAPPTDYELSTIRARYLGQKLNEKKPRLRKAQDKKVNFDWKAEDDTTATEQGSWRSQVVGQGPGAVMLGGRLAGFDEGGLRRGQTSTGDKWVIFLWRRF